jgi:SAM-dependent methyltransferase
MQDSSKEVVLNIIEKLRPASVLDVPCGDGWLVKKIDSAILTDGSDLYQSENLGYGKWKNFDLNRGIPDDFGQYDCIVSCEGFEHFGNPELFLRTAWSHLNPKGTLLITTPNTWYPQARLQYLLRGFFPSFPCLAGKIHKGDHMHIIPWSFPQLHLFLKLNSFIDIRLHNEPLSEAKHFYEKVLGAPQYFYCLRKAKKAVSGEENSFWKMAGSKESLYGRHLIITAVKQE